MKRLPWLVALRLCLLAAAAWAPLLASAQVVLTATSWVPRGHALAETQRDWCALLEQKSAGKARCNLLPRAVAGPAGTLDAVRHGQVDLAFAVHGDTPGRFVTTQVAEFPFQGDSAEALSVALQRTLVRTPAMAEEHRGVKVLTLFAHGPAMAFNTRRPVRVLEDAAGLKWRVDGGMAQEVAKALGLAVLAKPPTESYELLSTGTLEGTLLTAEAVESFKIEKLVRHATTFPGGLYNSSGVFLLNQARYDSLPPEVKLVVDELSGEFAARLFGKALDRADRRGLAYLQASGVQFTKADASLVKALSERMAPVVEAWALAAEGRGLANPKQALAAFRAEVLRLK